MHFVKMQGADNDFVVINNMDGAIPASEYANLAVRLCRRRLSIGADGMMVVIGAQRGGDYGMLFYNADGSLGEM